MSELPERTVAHLPLKRRGWARQGEDGVIHFSYLHHRCSFCKRPTDGIAVDIRIGAERSPTGAHPVYIICEKCSAKQG